MLALGQARPTQLMPDCRTSRIQGNPQMGGLAALAALLIATIVKGVFMATSTSTNYPDEPRRSDFSPNILDWIALLLVIIGGINWGLIAAMDYDLVAALFGDGSMVSRIVYALVGLAALYSLSFLARFPKHR
jgi:uncharacterized membrane protein YuzA (DUF378 family)